VQEQRRLPAAAALDLAREIPGATPCKGDETMLTLLARAALFLAVATATAAAQQTTEPNAAAAVPLLQPGETYIGPRLWVGNLNGAFAVGVQAERVFTQPQQYGPGVIAGGVGIDYYNWSYSYQPAGEYSYSVVPVQVFGNYHFVVPSLPKVDPYLGLALVYSFVNASWSGGGVAAQADASSLVFAAQGGARYFLSEKLALQGQVGFGYGTLGLGATWRF
jgi:hypothetical protein